MTSVWRRMQLLVAGSSPALRYQEEADVGVAAVLTCYRNLRMSAENKDKDNKQVFDDAVAFIQKKKFEKQREYVQDDVTKQMTKAFQSLLTAPVTQPSGKSISGFDPASETLPNGKTFKEEMGYRLQVQPSIVEGAGEGVKLEGRVPIGTAIALFPGTVYLPEHYRHEKYLKEISGNNYARSRFDSAIIDAKNEPSTPQNELAVGHKINHPPSGSMPNVMPFTFNFPPIEPFTEDEYADLIPNKYVEHPSRLSMFGKRIHMHSLAFITTADVEDEELFLNYRYNPDQPLPEWYTPVDAEADREMWKHR